MLILSRQQVREVDRRAIASYGMSGLVLMENAGRGATDVLCELLQQSGQANRPVVVVCGKGNNGGDGFVIARHLDIRRVRVRIALLCNPAELTGDAAANYSIIEKADVAIDIFQAPLHGEQFGSVLNGSGTIVDAILGTGATGEPKSPYAEAIELMNGSGIPILAVDLPSGLDCDTGAAARHTIRAAHTCTFVAAKPGLMEAGATEYIGHLHVCDIGVPRKLVDEITRS